MSVICEPIFVIYIFFCLFRSVALPLSSPADSFRYFLGFFFFNSIKSTTHCCYLPADSILTNYVRPYVLSNVLYSYFVSAFIYLAVLPRVRIKFYQIQSNDSHLPSRERKTKFIKSAMRDTCYFRKTIEGTKNVNENRTIVNLFSLSELLRGNGIHRADEMKSKQTNEYQLKSYCNFCSSGAFETQFPVIR